MNSAAHAGSTSMTTSTGSDAAAPSGAACSS
eukprot:CAMPEP_0168471326 /NCGR_PEP_ID=MMETSP0228-20121227/59224_1 /TAXON_ID=133427 /ORGANISM="Protoceratium reticulatum, Strain CCCM 535 (=CCMP 1889)" /LENGTH=30 /DNA_ID= /DNA_START= /DNA_END= /DNA_ORIENTATION=